MFSRKREERPKRNHGGNLSQYGLFDIPTDLSEDQGGGYLDGDDSDLEAELAALASDGAKNKKAPVRRRPVPNVNLDAMVAESIRDIPSDDDVSVDDDDPDLLNELSQITGEDDLEPESKESPKTPERSTPGNVTKVLEDRLKMYELAEDNAKKAGETSRARRFNRGIKTLKDLIKQVNAGKVINNDDIPPEVAVTIKKPPPSTESEEIANIQPSRPAPLPPNSKLSGEGHPERILPEEDGSEEQKDRSLGESNEGSPSEESKEKSPSDESEVEEKKMLSPESIELLKLLNTRKEEYKMAALKAKKSGDTAMAVNYIKISKQFEKVIQAVENNQPVDLSKMPGPPSDSLEGNATKPVRAESQGHQDSSGVEGSPISPYPGPGGVSSPAGVAIPGNQTAEVSGPGNEMTGGESEPQQELIQASSVAEALQQRLELYKSQEAAAKEQGNSSKARRMGRIVKQFEQAIKMHNAGKPVPFDELPTPPGYAAIPGTEPPKPPTEKEIANLVSPEEPKEEEPADGGEEAGGKSRPTPPPRASGNHVPTTRSEKQVALLVARQKEFKEAALNAKKKGELTQAKEYLRTAKGFDPLISAAMGGMPVDITSLPLPPSVKSQLDIDFDLVMKEECVEDDSGTADIMTRLETQLTKQLKMCLTTRDHHKALGDIAGMNRFEQLALTVTTDLDLIRLAKRTPGATVPKYHYENKSFSIVKSFTELNDNDLELTVVRGINYNCSNPKDIDTYVRWEFPYPQEEPVKDKTATVKDTNNPEYNTTVILPIQRSARPCLRVFKRHALKLEIYSKGGFFRSDTLLGTVNVKLQPLETQCEIHDSFDLLEGRKKIGGKLEVRLRVRQPLLTQQMEQLTEKWLVLDH